MISGYCLISLAFFVLKRLGNVRFFWKNLKWRAQKRNIYMLKGIRGYPDIPGKGSLMSQLTDFARLVLLVIYYLFTGCEKLPPI
jgi:hypothetical protein